MNTTKRRLKPVIAIDWDDTLCPFNLFTTQIAQEMGYTEVTYDSLTSWDLTGEQKVLYDIFDDPRIYEMQSEYLRSDEARDVIEAIREINEIADVYFLSAIDLKWMGVRATQIEEFFPELPVERIILGKAKDKVECDIMLDDAPSNILKSRATYPVLMRRPWNKNFTGMLTAETMRDFLELVRYILGYEIGLPVTGEPRVIALVGPSGSGKTKLAAELAKIRSRFTTICGVTTRDDDRYRTVSKEIFEKEKKAGLYIETTTYAGYDYGIVKDEVRKALSGGVSPVIPLDIVGAIGMKKLFPTSIIYVSRGTEASVYDVVSDKSLSDSEKVMRIMALSSEERNAGLCDLELDNRNIDKSVDEVIKFLQIDSIQVER